MLVVEVRGGFEGYVKLGARKRGGGRRVVGKITNTTNESSIKKDNETRKDNVMDVTKSGLRVDQIIPSVGRRRRG